MHNITQNEIGHKLIDLCFMCNVLLSFFIWPLYCLFFFDLRILIAPFGIFKLFLQQHYIKPFLYNLQHFYYYLSEYNIGSTGLFNRTTNPKWSFDYLLSHSGIRWKWKNSKSRWFQQEIKITIADNSQEW